MDVAGSRAGSWHNGPLSKSQENPGLQQLQQKSPCMALLYTDMYRTMPTLHALLLVLMGFHGTNHKIDPINAKTGAVATVRLRGWARGA